MFQINIDTEVLWDLRNTINEQQHISINKKYNYFTDRGKTKSKKCYAWDKICAIMDRLDDTVDYLNNIKLNTGRYKRSAFDFYE